MYRARDVDLPSEIRSLVAYTRKTFSLEVPRACPRTPHLLSALPEAIAFN